MGESRQLSHDPGYCVWEYPGLLIEWPFDQCLASFMLLVLPISVTRLTLTDTHWISLLQTMALHFLHNSTKFGL